MPLLRGIARTGGAEAERQQPCRTETRVGRGIAGHNKNEPQPVQQQQYAPPHPPAVMGGARSRSRRNSRRTSPIPQV